MNSYRRTQISTCKKPIVTKFPFDNKESSQSYKKSWNQNKPIDLCLNKEAEKSILENSEFQYEGLDLKSPTPEKLLSYSNSDFFSRSQTPSSVKMRAVMVCKPQEFGFFHEPIMPQISIKRDRGSIKRFKPDNDMDVEIELEQDFK